MSTNSPLYKLYAPEYNNALLQQILKGVTIQKRFPTLELVSCILGESPPMLGRDSEKDPKFGGEEHFNGFRGALVLVEASIYKSGISEVSSFLAEMRLALSPPIMIFGRQFLDTGRSLILSDTSGKKLMTEIVKQVKSNFPNRDFQQGAEAAQSVFLAYWKILEGKGINLTNKRAPI